MIARSEFAPETKGTVHLLLVEDNPADFTVRPRAILEMEAIRANMRLAERRR